MKLTLLLIISIFTLSVNAQVDALKRKQVKVALNSKVIPAIAVFDTVPVVVYATINKPAKPPAYFVDGEHFDQCIIKTLNLQLIDSMYIEKKEMKIEGKSYYGQIYIKMKKEYKPKLISLTDLKLKYTSLSTAPSIIMIDNKVVKGDYSKYLVDETYILKIVVEKVDIKEENLQVDLIRLVTKTEANIKEASKITIRGAAEAMLD